MILFALAISVLAQTSAVPQASGVVYIYAPKIAWHFGKVSDTFLLDDKAVANLGTEKFLKITLEPGRYKIQPSGKKQGGVLLNVKAGEKYFLRLERDVGTVIRTKGLIIVPVENASFDLATLKTVDKKEIKDSRVTSNKEDLP
ncbi:MAG: DUF2846 domain-containing protein [Pyrinomonadaceae bacterium]